MNPALPEKIKTWWMDQSPKQKKTYVLFGLVGSVTFLALFSGGEQVEVAPTKVVKQRVIHFDNRALEKSIFAQANEMLKKERAERTAKIGAMGEEMQKLRMELSRIKTNLARGGPASASGSAPKKGGAFPPAPGGAFANNAVRYVPGGGGFSVATNRQGAKNGALPEQKAWAGGATVVQAGSRERKKKKIQKTNLSTYLPVSILKATTLSGVHALVSEEGMGNPQPVILRVSLPAILPNNLKKNLKGCFIIAEGFGSLATERVEMRVSSISCVSLRGKAVIEEKIEGFVVDADGNMGLAGKVVAKFGASLARSALAGFIGGFGELSAQSAQQVTTDTTGQKTQFLNSKQIASGAMGQGLAKAAGALEKFYIALAKQSLPVVEILPGKRVDVIITKGVELHLRETEI